MRFIQYAIDAISLGGTFALASLSIALIFGLMRLINFAHAELITGAGYVMWYLGSRLELPWPLMVLGGIAAAAVAAVLMERVAFRPLRSATPVVLLIASFAVSFVLQNVFQVAFGSSSLPIPEIFAGSVRVGSLQFANITLVALTVNISLLTGTALFLKRTDLGIRMLASAEDFVMARILGVRANRVIATAFAISGALAGVVSVVLLAQTGIVHPALGVPPLLIAFVGVVLGGMGSLSGAALGGFVLGLMTTFLQVTLPAGLLPFRDAFLYGAVILMLLIRPHGLIGGGQMERTV